MPTSMRTYPTEKFKWKGLEVELRPNQHMPERYINLYVSGKLLGIYTHREARRISKQLLGQESRAAASQRQPLTNKLNNKP